MQFPLGISNPSRWLETVSHTGHAELVCWAVISPCLHTFLWRLWMQSNRWVKNINTVWYGVVVHSVRLELNSCLWMGEGIRAEPAMFPSYCGPSSTTVTPSHGIGLVVDGTYSIICGIGRHVRPLAQDRLRSRVLSHNLGRGRERLPSSWRLHCPHRTNA